MPLEPLPPVMSPEQAEAEALDRGPAITQAEMRDAIEAAYVRRLPEGSTFGVPVPEDVTPTGWYALLPPAVEAMTPDEFADIAETVGTALAGGGHMEHLTTFAPLRLEDRPRVEHRTTQGRVRVRERALIVHALGWS